MLKIVTLAVLLVAPCAANAKTNRPPSVPVQFVLEPDGNHDQNWARQLADERDGTCRVNVVEYDDGTFRRIRRCRDK